MTKMICSCCGAPIVPSITQAFLICEYCDTSAPNPHYDQSAAEQAAKPSASEICIASLLEMGEAQNLDNLDSSCFGKPIHAIAAARAGLSIPDAQQVYFLYAHTILLLGFSDGLALTDGGVYYSCDSGKGSLSWDAFVTGAVSCTDRTGSQNGTLKIGSGVELGVKSEKDSRLARFLVDFHNHAYHLYTGETAPAAWNVSEAPDAEENDPSLLDVLLPTAAALLGGSAVRKQPTVNRQTIVRRVSGMHPTNHPTVHLDRRQQIHPPRPLQFQPHHHPAIGKPNRADRPGGPGSMRGPGGQHRVGGGMRGPGKGRR